MGIFLILLKQSVNDTQFLNVTWLFFSTACLAVASDPDLLIVIVSFTRIFHHYSYRDLTSALWPWIWFDYLCCMFYVHGHLPQSIFCRVFRWLIVCVFQQTYDLLVLHSLSIYLQLQLNKFINNLLQFFWWYLSFFLVSLLTILTLHLITRPSIFLDPHE